MKSPKKVGVVRSSENLVLRQPPSYRMPAKDGRDGCTVPPGLGRRKTRKVGHEGQKTAPGPYASPAILRGDGLFFQIPVQINEDIKSGALHWVGDQECWFEFRIFDFPKPEVESSVTLASKPVYISKIAMGKFQKIPQLATCGTKARLRLVTLPHPGNVHVHWLYRSWPGSNSTSNGAGPLISVHCNRSLHMHMSRSNQRLRTCFPSSQETQK